MTASNDVAWGLVGRHLWEASPYSRRPGVTRKVDGGVRYDRPPLASPAPYWIPDQDTSQKYHLDWPDPAAARSLASLADDLRRRPPTSADDPRAAALNAAVVRLLDRIEELHAADHGIGLLTPANVLVAGTGPDADVLLPDLGFAWVGALTRPGWLSDKTYEPIWGRPAAVQQFHLKRGIGTAAADAGGLDAGAADFGDAAGDLAVVARVLASALAGRVVGAVAAARPKGAAAVWTTLADAEAGRFADAAAFRDALSEYPPAEHFLRPPVPVPAPDGTARRRSAAWWLVPLATVAVAAVAVGWFFRDPLQDWWKQGAVVTKGGGKGPIVDLLSPPAGPSFDDLATEADVTAVDPAAPEKWTGRETEAVTTAIQTVGEMYALPPESLDPSQVAKRKEIRRQVAERMLPAYEATVVEYNSETVQAIRNLKRLVTAMQTLETHPADDPETQAKEKQWLKHFRDTLAQWSPPSP